REQFKLEFRGKISMPEFYLLLMLCEFNCQHRGSQRDGLSSVISKCQLKIERNRVAEAIYVYRRIVGDDVECEFRLQVLPVIVHEVDVASACRPYTSVLANWDVVD